MPRRSLVAAVLLATAAIAGPAAQPATAEVAPTPLTFPGGPASAQDPAPVTIDADLYLPTQTPAPAVVLAHGFGGSKQSVAAQAQGLADRGFVVLAYSARGFGKSTGQISMNSPDFEVADARKAIDILASRSEVTQDGAGDPRVGFAGGSYGGALSLLVAGYDMRVDAIAADITWNDLESSLFAQSIEGGEPLGVFKKWWVGSFFASGAGLPKPGSDSTCGRFAPQWCVAFEQVAESGVLTDEARGLMRASSPRSITDKIRIPTLIGAGQADSLFPFAQATANADQIRVADPQTPVKVVWHGGGHDGGVDESARLLALTGDWMDEWLRGGPAVSQSFEVTLTGGALGADSRRRPTVVTLPSFTGLRGSEGIPVALAGPPQLVVAPAGGVPATISSVPGLGGSLSGFVNTGIPGQVATFASEPVASDALIVGSPRVTLRVSSDQPVSDVALFANLRIQTSSGLSVAPQGLVAPIRLDSVTGDGVTIDVDLPAIATRLSAGDRIAVIVTTTDATYALPSRPAVYRVELASPSVVLPVARGESVSTGDLSPWLLLAIPIIIVVILLVIALRPRQPKPATRPDLAEVPVVIEGLRKEYRGGVLAVDDVSFSVPRGIVLGLLGPNGAGKTTTMRMLMGLIRPSAGEMWVYGERIHAGAPVLSRVGALVEGAGFLPHLTGRQNLELYWKSSGRQGDPGLEELFEIAGLGTAIDRRVKSYSQGMRQRLGIAQAMLGRPDLLVLDEPTNGLDPPQIREMRDVLRGYAATGRTVIVSSHLLAEVEMTCTHVVVMQRGRLVAQGEVSELLAGRERLEDVFLDIVGHERIVGGG